MEMTTRRWIAIVGLSCAALAALRLPPHRESRGAQWIVQKERNAILKGRSLHSRLTDLGEASIVIERRDMLVAAARANPDRDGPITIATAKLTASERLAINQATAAQAAAIGERARTLVVGVVSDSAEAVPSNLNYDTDRQFLLPAATDGETCVTILRMGRARRDLKGSTRDGIFGPCAFYAVFGAPGPAVAAWLRKRAYDVAFDATWPGSPDPNPSVVAVRASTRDEDLRRWLDLSRSFQSPDITACSSGDLEFCATAFRTPSRHRQRPLPGVVFPARGFWGFDSPLGPYGPAMLADLLAVHGRAKFEKFWKSSGDLEVAFTSAFGESTGQWTMRWMQYRYGRDTRGPYIARRSALMSIASSLTLVAICAAFAYRREAV